MPYKFNPFTGNFDEVSVASYAALNLLGTVANAAALPGSATTGDVYQAEDTGIFYVWDGAAWDNIGTLAGPQGATGATGPAGADGADGVGVIAGGTTGQALVKASNTDYDTQWSDVTAVAAIDDLTDVAITTPSDGQVLEYDSATSQWINAAPTGGGGTPGGADTQVQFNSSGAFAGSADLTWDDTAKELGVGGDINLDDGGTYTTTLQTITPTANRKISFPNATGTIALVAGSNGQFMYNNAGALGGLSTFTTDGTNLTALGRLIAATNGAASAPPVSLTGTWFTGGTSTTTKPQLLIEPAGTTSTSWTTSGTGLGVNAASGFAGNLLDLQVNGTSQARISSAGAIFGGVITCTSVGIGANNAITGGSNNIISFPNSSVAIDSNGSVGGFSVNGNGFIGFASGAPGATASIDATFRRDAANTLAQRNGTNAQTYRLYNTYTSATSFERAKLSWNTNVLEVGTEKGGDGGTARDMVLQTDGTTRITLKADGAILFSGLPTSDPAVAGQLWNDGNTLKISAG